MITLAIIGVVAALTIPNVIVSYKKHVIETKLKTAYSMLSGMFNAAVADYGTLDFSQYYGTTRNTPLLREKYVAPYLKYQSYETDRTLDEHGYENGILYPNNNAYASKTSKVSIFKMPNGMAIMPGTYTVAKNSGDKVYFMFIFVVDIDGPYKGQNTFGKDIFVFSQYFIKNSPLLMYGDLDKTFGTYGNSYDINNDPNGIKSKYALLFNLDSGDMIVTQKRPTREEMLNECKSGGNGSMTCGALIKHDGWKVKSDYPWL